MEIKYNIGDKVYHAVFNAHKAVYVECPHCGGTGRIRCIFHDETIISIDCGNCSRGYESPTGKVLVYNNIADTEELIITGVEIREVGQATYRAHHRLMDEDRLFTTEEEALAKANEMHEAYVKEQKENIFKKEKPTKSWAWNASYHRNLIKRAEKDIEYHTAKLNVANLKKKN